MEKDDEHLCIICRAVIQGLEEYVSHRKFHCQPSRSSKNDAFFLQCQGFESEISNDHHKQSSQVFSPHGQPDISSETHFMESLGLSSIQLAKIPGKKDPKKLTLFYIYKIQAIFVSDLLSPRTEAANLKSEFSFQEDRGNERLA